MVVHHPSMARGYRFMVTMDKGLPSMYVPLYHLQEMECLRLEFL